MKKTEKNYNAIIIMMILIALTLVVGACFAFIEHFSEKNQKPVEVESPLTIQAKEVCHTLYRYRNTKYNDINKINSVIKNLNYIEFNFVNAELSLNDENLLNVLYKVDTRANFRIMSDYHNDFYQTAITLFSLVDDLNVVRISVSDDYGEFSSFSLDKKAIEEYVHTSEFTQELLKSSTQSEASYVDFTEKILTLEVPAEGKNFERKIYEQLPSELELVAGSVTEISDTISLLEAKYIEEFDVDMSACRNKPCEIKFYSVNDYTKSEISPYIFVFCEGDLVSFKQLEDDSAKIKIISALND